MEIHPRRVSESLSDLIGVLTRVWRTLLLPALVSSVAVAVASYFILRETGALDLIDLTTNQPDLLETLADDELSDLLFDFMSGFIWVAIVSGAIYGFLYLLAARAVAEQVSDAKVEMSALAVAGRLYVPWLVAISLTYLGVIVGLALLILPGIWIGVSLALATPAMAIEEAGPVTALKRSYDLVKGNWWDTLGFLLLIGLIGGTATQFIQLFAVPVLLVGAPSIAFGVMIALALAVQGIIVAAIAVGCVVWYLNLRARADGPYVLEIS